MISVSPNVLSYFMLLEQYAQNRYFDDSITCFVLWLENFDFLLITNYTMRNSFMRLKSFTRQTLSLRDVIVKLIPQLELIVLKIKFVLVSLRRYYIFSGFKFCDFSLPAKNKSPTKIKAVGFSKKHANKINFQPLMGFCWYTINPLLTLIVIKNKPQRNTANYWVKNIKTFFFLREWGISMSNFENDKFMFIWDIITIFLPPQL